ncbi:MAG TPA: response regulator, partial [bacterium]|nr:response regulator [bacterium]
MEILVVEDSRTQAEFLGHLLEEHGYAVKIAGNGNQALSMVNESRPAVIISDVLMPEMDGYGLCHEMKSDANLKEIPFILVTQLSKPSDIIKGLQCGADNFIVKPYDKEYLLSHLDHILNTLELRKKEKTGKGVDVFIAGQEYSITSGRQQMLDLLISTYETAIRRNIDLLKARDELAALNKQLEDKVSERTAALRTEIEEHKRADEALRESEKRLRELSSELLRAQENERRRIAAEIHDGLGQVLSALKFKVESILQWMEQKVSQEASRPLEDLIPIIQEGIEEARRIQMDLRPPTLDDLGILPTLSWFCRRFQSTYSKVCILDRIDIRESEVPESLKTVIYRITQEALNNVAKHSQGNSVRLSLQKNGGRIELSIHDNGRGFDMRSTQKGLGLSSMKERAELSGGTFSVET